MHRQYAYYMIYLIRCVLHNKKPSNEKISKMDLAMLYEYAVDQSLAAIVAYALESAGIDDKDFEEAKNKAICKNIMFDAERMNILAELEKEHIWYMPLKGVLLKEYYPRLGMRQMSDNDILYDGDYRKKVKDIMYSMDYECDHFGKGKDDAYFKLPVYNFEMHEGLFTHINFIKIYDYYKDIKKKLIKDDDNDYGYHFRQEDYYIYMIAHEYGHYALDGTGLRSLVDTYVYLEKFGNELDWDYIHNELTRLEIADYEKLNRVIAQKLFNGVRLDDDEKEKLDYYIFSGTYGTLKNNVKNGIQSHGKGSKIKYILYRVFPPLSYYKISVPWAYKNKILLPFGWVYRIIRGIVSNHKQFVGEIRQLKKK